ncbi:ABC transporter ATP-binding protein [Alkalibacterium pelagium]|uniref:ABC-2 type transport system ATP-binding protein n=1 Tax=Alkalibacterium pelagium TaxID=426702 RepID=A0A1H7P4U4_9LACT|nr:ABC transporter ATP-binding protein [Alkalibacterium pelagium]GEN51546.1 sodium ABC transporter ATP-binding protein [Alkalibacterium pelagium]SEL30616.1 ABC-2 type transport system ATP-binding protein [Alkalibacterium pelagium]
MLEVKNLRKTFGDLTAVEDVSFTIRPGEIMGLIGQNGAGKTTTFRIILDLLTADQGEVLWENQHLSKKIFNKIGYLPEERGLYPKVSIENQILYFAQLRGKKKSEISPLIDDWLKKFDVKGKKTDKVKTLSKGNQQKVQLICTLIHEPELIILDEPFSGLDPVNAELLEEGIREAQSKGARIIFSSHNMNNVEELCDSLIMLKNGRQVLNGAVRDIREQFGRTKLFLESDLSREALLEFPGVQRVEKNRDGIDIVYLTQAEEGKAIFEAATRNGYIPTFSQQPPTLEEIFKRMAGERNE